MKIPEDNPPKRSAAAGLTIRAIRVSDAEAVTTLVNLPAFRYGTLRIPFQTLEETRKRIETMPQGNISIVAELDGTLVGDAHLMRNQGRRAHAASIGMGVHDDYAGRGIGSALMAALVDTADNWLDIKRLELTVYTDNPAALALYRKFGFEQEGLLKAFAYRAGEYVDAHTMARVRV